MNTDKTLVFYQCSPVFIWGPSCFGVFQQACPQFHAAHPVRAAQASTFIGLGIMGSMLTRYIHEAMKRARYRTLKNGTSFGQIPGLTGVWANEAALDECRKVLQEVLEEWLILRIRDRDPIPRLVRITLPLSAA
jgi:predicted RNase H-like HicB family nuclease